MTALPHRIPCGYDPTCPEQFERWYATQMIAGRTPELRDAFFAGWYAVAGQAVPAVLVSAQQVNL